eukprot:7345233-Prymnesium_polylepis.1
MPFRPRPLHSPLVSVAVAQGSLPHSCARALSVPRAGGVDLRGHVGRSPAVPSAGRCREPVRTSSPCRVTASLG